MLSVLRGFCLFIVMLVPDLAFGITLTNRDPTDQKLVVIEGDSQKEKIVKAGEKIQICPQSCVIRMADGEDYEFDGPEIVSLEEGLLFLDNPEEQPKPPQ